MLILYFVVAINKIENQSKIFSLCVVSFIDNETCNIVIWKVESVCLLIIYLFINA